MSDRFEAQMGTESMLRDMVEMEERRRDRAELQIARIRAAVEQHGRLNPGPATDMLLRKVRRILDGEETS